MNNKRRKILHKVLDALESLREPSMDKDAAISGIESALSDLNFCLDEEQFCVDSRPENLRWSSKTEDMQDNIDDMSSAQGDMECALSDVKKMDKYDYSIIKNDIQKSVRAINLSICR